MCIRDDFIETMHGLAELVMTGPPVLGLACVLALCPIQQSTATEERERDLHEDLQESSDRWRIPANCGPNALYAMLNLYEIDATLAEVMHYAPPSQRGVSLANLKAASCALGLPVRVMRATPKQLTTLPSPVIAHLSGLRDGHFVVVLTADERTVVFADMVACTIRRVSIEAFKKNWSGYLLVRDTGLLRYQWPWILSLGIALVAFSIVWRIRR